MKEFLIDFKSIALTTRPRMLFMLEIKTISIFNIISIKNFIFCSLKTLNFLLIKILKFNLKIKKNLFFPSNNLFDSLQKILPYCSYYNKKKSETSCFGKNKLKSFSELWSNKKEKIIFRLYENKINFSEIFVKNYILETRTKILKKLVFKIHSTRPGISQDGSKKNLKFTKAIGKKLRFYGFSENLVKKFFCIFNWSFQNSFKEKKFITNNFRLKFFYLEEFIDFFKIYFMKNQINKVNQIISFMNLYYFQKKKGDKKVFEIRKFLNKLFNLKKIKKFIYKHPTSSLITCKKENKLIFFNFSKNKLLFSPKFKGQKIFLEIFQKNLNLYLEFEKLTIKLTSSPYLKIKLKNIRPSINLDIYHLFLFKFLNLMNVINSKILNTFFLLDKKFYQIYKKTNLPYSDIRKITLQLKKPCIFKNLSFFRNENIYLINLKLTQIINNLLCKIKIKTCTKENKPTLSSFKILLNSKKRPKFKFLRVIGNCESLFQNRVKLLLFFFSDSFILKSNIRFFQFNGFDFKGTGF